VYDFINYFWQAIAARYFAKYEEHSISQLAFKNIVFSKLLYDFSHYAGKPQHQDASQNMTHVGKNCSKGTQGGACQNQI